MNRMKPVLLLLLCALWQAPNIQAQDIGNVTIDIELKNATLAQALHTIETLTHFTCNYKTADIADVKGIWYKKEQVTVKKVLTDILSGTSLQFEQVQNDIFIKKVTGQPAGYVTVYGFVTSARSGETLIGATVSISNHKTYATITNAYGFYSLTVPAAEYQLNCSYVGFGDFESKITVRQTFRNNIEMQERNDNKLQSVTVAASGKKNIARRVITGHHRLDIADIKKMAMAGGEPDVLKSLQFLPGIQTSNEGTTNLSVRGGSYDQNLILLDEAPVYNPTHTLGFFSAFNTDALKDVSIYKGVYPAQYGGRLSSVVDVRMKEGNVKEQALSGGIGFLATRLTYEGPIAKDRSSFMISGRYSNIGMLMNMAHTKLKINTTHNKVAFYDLNVKINPVLGNKDRLYLSAYTGHDNFYLDLLDRSDKMEWGNSTVTARWNHVFNPVLFANTSLLYSNYNYSNANLDDSRNFSWRARLQEATLKTDFDWIINSNNMAKFGIGISKQELMPGKVIPKADEATSKSISLNNRQAALLNAYISNEQKITKRISVSYGLRATIFAALGPRLVYKYNEDSSAVVDSTWYPKGKIVKSYFGAEPRITVRTMITGTSSIKLSYGRNYQFQHLLTNSSVGLPTDIWLPSDTYFQPQYSDQFAAGVYKTFFNETWEASLEGYYQQSYHVIDFKDNAELFLNDKLETQVRTGQAKGYGLEWLLKKNKGQATGWISYTWSKSLRRIEGVNHNEWYPPTFDHRHNFSLVYNQNLGKRLSFSVNWVYRSGGHTTVPLGTYIFSGARFMYYGNRNGYTLPAYHRLDFNTIFQGRGNPKRKWQGEWVFSVYNLYNRKNIFALFISQDPYGYGFVKASEIYLVGALPTLTYNFKF